MAIGDDPGTINAGMEDRTALVVDEHEVVRYGCVELLQRHGIGACYQTDSIVQAYRIFRRRRPALLVQAWPMDKHAAMKLIRRVHDHAHACPIVVYSHHGSALGVVDVLRTGAAAFITKSSPPGILFEGVRRALRGEMYISPDLAQKLALSKGIQSDNPASILSERERTVFELVVAGVEIGQIANRLTLPKRTVSNYLVQIKSRLGVNSVAALVRIDMYHSSRVSDVTG